MTTAPSARRRGEPAVDRALLTEITHREPQLSGRRVLLEKHGDDAMRAAISRAVKSGKLTVAAVERSPP